MDDNDDGASENGTKSTAPRFAFITPSGWGNLGDAAIVDSLIHAVRERVPGARIVGYTLNHADTGQRHGVEAGPLTGCSVPFYPVLPADVGEGFDPPSYDGTDVPADRPQDARARLRSLPRKRSGTPVTASRTPWSIITNSTRLWRSASSMRAYARKPSLAI